MAAGKSGVSIQASKARAKFSKLVSQASRGNAVVIHHRENGDVVMVAKREYDSLIAGQRLLHDTDLQQEIATSRRQIAKGEYLTYERWRQEMGLAPLPANHIA